MENKIDIEIKFKRMGKEMKVSTKEIKKDIYNAYAAGGEDEFNLIPAFNASLVLALINKIEELAQHIADGNL